MGDLWNSVMSNWELISTILLGVGGSYAVKVKLAVNSVLAAIEDMKETRAVYEKAMEDGNISAEEAKEIGRELSEDLEKVQIAAKSITAILPKTFRKHIPVTFNNASGPR